jgi:hypothetical protein
VVIDRALAWLSNWTWLIPVAMLAFLFLLFPTGHLRSRGWRGGAWLAGVAFALATAWQLIDATRSWVHPFGSSGGGLATVLDAATARPGQCGSAGQRGRAGRSGSPGHQVRSGCS